MKMAGIIQEQHPDRARLFTQWKQMDWPILVDSLNLLGVSVVPVTLAIDEHGIVRAINPQKETIVDDFLAKQFEPPAGIAPPASARLRPAVGPTPRANAAADVWRRHAESQFVWGGPGGIAQAIRGFDRALATVPTNGATHFRQGVAYRARYDSPGRQATDFRRAVEHWQRAVTLDPNQYIWRRRIQQYGPRLNKPYPFYDWVPEARAAIRARGETPVPLDVEPAGAEIAQPIRTFTARESVPSDPDPRGRIHRDRGEFISVETVAVPTTIAPGDPVRAHLIFRPNLARKAHWNNEVDDLIVRVNPPTGWQVDERHLSVPRPPTVVSQETRRTEFELRSPATAAAGRVAISASAFYYVCEDVDGTCLYRRQDIAVELHVRR